MRISNAPDGMKIRQIGDGKIEVSMEPVRMKYKRKCGWIVEWKHKNEPCPCYRCSQERLK